MPNTRRTLKSRARFVADDDIGEDGSTSVDLGLMTPDRFRLWSFQALETFLKMRRKSTDGNFEELVSRAFGAWEEKLSCSPEAEHELRQHLSDYRDKLTGPELLPDPLTLQHGWVGEWDMGQWSPIHILNIAEYFRLNTPELYERLCCEYEQENGLRYFRAAYRVDDVQFHPISPSHTCAVYSARGKPCSKAGVAGEPCSKSCQAYQAWVAVNKGTTESPGGNIRSAYCTCTAGLLGTCAHIAGLLFRVEYCVRTQPSDRDLCRPMAEMWKEDCGKKGRKKSVRKHLAGNSTQHNNQQTASGNSDKSLHELAESLKDIAPDSCFIQTHYAMPFKE